MIWFMTTVHVRANQTTVDWAEGAEFVCERTPLVDNLIQHGGLTELDDYTDTSHLRSGDGNEQLNTLNSPVDPERPLVQYADRDVIDAISNVDVARASENSSSEERQDAEKALADAQADATAAQEDLTEASADTLSELNTELDNEPPKPPRTRRKTS